MLLLDLDGVVVFEAEPPFFLAREIILLHQNLKATIESLEMPVVILTHRSQREAKHILACIGLSVPTSIAAVMAAEDLFLAGVRYAPKRMFNSWIAQRFDLTGVGAPVFNPSFSDHFYRRPN